MAEVNLKKIKLKIKKNDTVIVISGNSRGKSGRVLAIYRKTNRILVEGINIISRHTKANQKNPDGGIIKKESSVHISNVMLVDPKTGTATRVGRKLTEKGKLKRYSKKSGEIIES
jgi:large subunit ribosomal protein L24